MSRLRQRGVAINDFAKDCRGHAATDKKTTYYDNTCYTPSIPSRRYLYISKYLRSGTALVLSRAYKPKHGQPLLNAHARLRQVSRILAQSARALGRAGRSAKHGTAASHHASELLGQVNSDKLRAQGAQPFDRQARLPRCYKRTDSAAPGYIPSYRRTVGDTHLSPAPAVICKMDGDRAAQPCQLRGVAYSHAPGRYAARTGY